MKHLTFRLEVEDGWPPVAAESIPCIEGSSGLRVTVPPLFVKDLAVGDQVEVIEEENGQVIRWKPVKVSGHSTIWIMPKNQDIEPELEALRSIGCNTAAFPGGVLYSIDLPPNLSPAEVDKRFAPIKTQIAIAYPTWRHKD